MLEAQRWLRADYEISTISINSVPVLVSGRPEDDRSMLL